MFANLTSRRGGRRIWSPSTIALSVAAHALLLGGIAYASANAPRRERVVEIPLEHFPQVEPQRVTPPPPPPPQEVRQVEAAPPKGGDFVTLTPPAETPDRLPEVDPGETPLTPDMTSGIGTPTPDAEGVGKPPAGAEVAGEPSGSEGVYEAAGVDERPRLRNAREMERLLQRHYPALLQTAGITGQTVLRFVIDAQGRVEPGSIEVVEASNAGFAEPSLKVAEKFQFAPARVRGRPVRVTIAMPITWTLDDR